MNISKSCIYGIGIETSEVENVANSVNCSYGSLPFFYLGIPVGRNMRHKARWKEVVDRLSSWKAKLLSIGGRLTLVNAVLGTLPLYYFSLFKAPMKVINLLESIRCRFFWDFKEGKKGIAWIKWKSILHDKDKGGLGVGSLKAKNIGLLGKWKWRFLNEKDALWVRVIKAISMGIQEVSRLM